MINSYKKIFIQKKKNQKEQIYELYKKQNSEFDELSKNHTNKIEKLIEQRKSEIEKLIQEQNSEIEKLVEEQNNEINEFENQDYHDYPDLKIIAAVRNPYDRIISDLFFNKLIKIDSNPEFVEEIIYDFINSEYHIYDNHNQPQYKYVCDENDELIKDIIILRNENLNEDMKKIGFELTNNFQVINKGKLNYDNYLNEKV